MFFWRKFEDKLAGSLHPTKSARFLHLYNGQEAILAGALHVMELGKDRMITAYRNHVQPHWNGRGSQTSYGRIIWQSHWDIQWPRGLHAYFFQRTSFSWRTWYCRRTNSSWRWNGLWG